MGAATIGQGSGPTGPTTARAHILLVDDDVDIRRSVGALLEDEGYQVSSVDNGRLAWDRLHQSPAPDLLILDLMLPGMDGWQLRNQQRRDPSVRDIPVLAISADASPKAAAISADGFLSKPFAADDLLVAVKRLLHDRVTFAAGDQLRELHRLALLGTLTANIEHQLRNPLAFLLTNVRMACDALLDQQAGRPSPFSSPAEMSGMVGDARAGAERIHAIVEAMGLMARARTSPMRGASLETVLQAVVHLTSGHLRRRVRLAPDVPLGLTINVDESTLVQVMTSLLLSQLSEAGQPSGLDVEIAARAEAGRAIIEIRSPAPLAPPAGAESLLGLGLCRSMLEPSGGSIELEAQNATGPALVRLTLPLLP